MYLHYSTTSAKMTTGETSQYTEIELELELKLEEQVRPRPVLLSVGPKLPDMHIFYLVQSSSLALMN